MADPIGVSMRLRDYLGRTASTVLYLPSATSYANAQTYATAFSLLLDLVAGARVEDIAINFGGTLDAGIKAVPTAGQQLYTAGNLAFNVNGLSKGYTYTIPGLLESLLSGKKGIDTTAPALANLISAFTAGIDIGGGVFIQPVNPYGMDLISFRAGSRASRFS